MPCDLGYSEPHLRLATVVAAGRSDFCSVVRTRRRLRSFTRDHSEQGLAAVCILVGIDSYRFDVNILRHIVLHQLAN